VTTCDPNTMYDWLMGSANPRTVDPCDAHVLACVFALARAEASAAGRHLIEAIGLDGRELAKLVEAVFPHAHIFIDEIVSCPPVFDRSDDESYLGELLSRYTSDGTALQLQLSLIIARRAMRPNHLWQDLGLRDRNELSQLMMRHFRRLSDRNAGNMKWKKFLYRMICRDEGFRLCTAPSCAECDDFSVCFDDEAGESLFAHNRRQMERDRDIGLQSL